MRKATFRTRGLLAAVALATACGGGGQGATDVKEIARLPVDVLTGIITQSDVAIDPEVSVDGQGSLRVTATAPTTVRLYEMGDVDVENARLIYQAKVKTRDLKGTAYLEMWCHFSGQGEFFSRGLASTLSGTVDWTSQETPFFLQKGQNPDNVKLNLVVQGTGTAWIDDIRLLRAPLG
jgi:hypothetical protein